MNRSLKPSEDQKSKATWWLIRLEAEDMSELEHAEFRRWLLASREHEEAFAQQSEWWFRFPTLITSEIRAQCAAAIAEGDQREKAEIQARRRRFVPLAAAAAVLIAVLVGAFAVREAGVTPRNFATQTGQHRTIALKDGNVVHLNTRTRIKWLGGMADPAVELIEGEALFDIATNPAHPFRVLIDSIEVRVLGTRFNVYRKRSGEVVVTVLEGAVQVKHPAWQRTLHQNEQVAYNTAGSAPQVRHADASRAVKWREGLLDIQGSLSEAVEELSRYTDRKIIADDPRLQSITVAAVLQVRDVRLALNRLEEVLPINVTDTQSSFRLAYRDSIAPQP